MKKLILHQWDQAFYYFQNHLKILFWLMLVFFIFLVVGSSTYFFNHPEMTKELYLELMTVFESKISVETQGIELFFGIFFNNLWAGGMSILLGFIPFLFIPMWTLISNALIIGIVGGVYRLNGFGIFAFLIGILPHGLLEIPAFILSVSLGMDLCIKLVKTIFKKFKRKKLNETIKNTIRIYFLWIVPLLLLAAIIETYITPVLFRIFM